MDEFTHGPVKAVYASKGTGPFRTLVYYKVINIHQKKLPRNFYSAGYVERVTGVKWELFPEFPLKLRKPYPVISCKYLEKEIDTSQPGSK